MTYRREGDTAAEAESVPSISARVFGSLLARYHLYNGAVRAIASDVLLEVYLVWSYTRLLPQGTLDGESLQDIGRCVAASIPMVVLMAFLSAQGWGLWSLPPCVIVYLAMCMALGCLRLQDLTPVCRAFARKMESKTL